MIIDENFLKKDLQNLQLPNYDIDSEVNHIINYLQKETVRLLINHNYVYCGVLGAGGSGTVLQINDKFSDTNRALKISRKALSDTKKTQNLQWEISAMSMVSHGNLTHLYQAFQDEDGYCFIYQLVKNAQKIDQWLIKQKDYYKNIPHEYAIDSTITSLAVILLQIAKALCYMHDEINLYHMDIKPSNILIDSDSHPYLTDLGFARCKSKYKDDDDVPVGFTFGYEHPRLRGKRALRITQTIDKSTNKLKGKEISPIYDLFSFGRTLLALLKIVDNLYREEVKKSYKFQFLHLLATLCLDGRNNINQANIQDSEFLSEIALGIRGKILSYATFRTFHQVQERLERLLNFQSIEYLIPELNAYYKTTINHGTGFLNLTPRIINIIDHPVFKRLRSIQHLGLVDQVYPNANHTRFSHSLGVCDYVCRYFRSLYNDPENPIFKVIVNKYDMEKMILAALLHDLGQSKFGHDLEEINEDIFKHSEITKFILYNDSIRDKNNKTLKDIIEGNDYNCWNIPLKEIEELLFTHIDMIPYYAYFKNMINGPIDADKLDYLLRDGKACNVSYPNGLDIERFLKCLTIIPKYFNDNGYLYLAVKEKGLSSAEVVTIIRQKMYQSIYLHHSSRCIKSMILTSCYNGLNNMLPKINTSLLCKAEDVIRDMYIHYIMNLDYSVSLKNQKVFSANDKKYILAIWDRIINNKNTEEVSDILYQQICIDSSISFFYQHMDDLHKTLLKNALNRNMYSRLADLSLSKTTNDDELSAIRSDFSWSKKSDYLKKIEDELISSVKNAIENQKSTLWSNDMTTISNIDKIIAENVLLISDLPSRRIGPGGDPPQVMGDIFRKRGEVKDADWSSKDVGHIWTEGMNKMMKEIIKVRIYCEPNFYQIITSYYDIAAINSIIKRHCHSWKIG